MLRIAPFRLAAAAAASAAAGGTGASAQDGPAPQTPFEALGLEVPRRPGQYTAVDIKAAYKRTALRVHPDVAGGSQRRFVLAQLALKILEQNPNDTLSWVGSTDFPGAPPSTQKPAATAATASTTSSAGSGYQQQHQRQQQARRDAEAAAMRARAEREFAERRAAATGSRYDGTRGPADGDGFWQQQAPPRPRSGYSQQQQAPPRWGEDASWRDAWDAQGAAANSYSASESFSESAAQAARYRQRRPHPAADGRHTDAEAQAGFERYQQHRAEEQERAAHAYAVNWGRASAAGADPAAATQMYRSEFDNRHFVSELAARWWALREGRLGEYLREERARRARVAEAAAEAARLGIKFPQQSSGWRFGAGPMDRDDEGRPLFAVYGTNLRYDGLFFWNGAIGQAVMTGAIGLWFYCEWEMRKLNI